VLLASICGGACPAFADGPVGVVLDTARLRHDASGEVLVESFPLSVAEHVDLSLRRFSITRPDTRFVVVGAGGTKRPLAFDPDRVILLRGEVTDEPGSSVFLAVGPDSATGRIIRESGRSFVISAGPRHGAEAELAELTVTPVAAAASAAGAARSDCGLEAPDTSGMDGGIAGLEPGLPPGAVRQIELAIDTDHEYFALFGDADAAADYLVQLYGAVTDVYVRDVRASFVLTFVRLWETPDDLFNQENPLDSFLVHWNQNMDDVPRDLAQLVSGRRDMPFGGIAYVNVLCNQNFAYSVIGYVLGGFADPSRPHPFNRDISLAAHELGHNVAVPHTHSVGIDSCNDPDTQPQRGTIMSYCGQTFTGGAANLDLRFHRVMADAMRSTVATAGCVGNDCNLNGVEDADDIAKGTSMDANGDGVPDDCQDCNGNGVLDPLDVALLTSLDLNGNDVPDECEPDCNGNGLPDDLDVDGVPPTSEDAYGDRVPDECETDCNGNGISDYAEIQLDMALDLDRDARIDDCQDCDGDGTSDLVELAGANNLWVADLLQPRIRQYLWLTGTGSGVSADVGLSAPQDVLAMPDGRVLVSSGADDRIVQLDAAGNDLGDLVPAPGPLDLPAGMVLMPGGDLLVANRGTDSVLRYTGDGEFVGTFVTSGAGGLVAPFGLAFDAGGDLCVTSDDGRVLRYDGRSGAFVGELVSSEDSGGLSEPRGMLFLPAGDLLVASHGSDAVLRYDGATGAFLGRFNNNGTASVLTLDQPWGIRLGPDGGVYVSRAHDHDLPAASDPAGTGALHLTNARLYHFDAVTGDLVRAYVQGVDSGIANPTGFAFLPSSVGGGPADCNGNLVPDACDIAAGTSLDRDGDGVPDECGAVPPPACPADVDGSGEVDVDDLVTVILQWGTDGADGGDVDGSGEVDVDDIVAVVLDWGACP
jgi:hypothetical protein